jgi:hypothetical protein
MGVQGGQTRVPLLVKPVQVLVLCQPRLGVGACVYLLLTDVQGGTERGRVLAPVHALAKAARIAHRAGAAHDGRHLQHQRAHGAYRGWL